MLVVSPEAVQEGTVTSYLELGKAYVDTMVFHLDRQFKDAGDEGQAWMTRRLEDLLALFRVGAGPLTRSRMRDALSFVYGGLHFGTGVSVQLAEVMNRLLGPSGHMTAGEKAQVLHRSVRPAYRLAALNIDHVVYAYQALQGPVTPGNPPSPGQAATATWMRAEAFHVQESGGRPWRVDLRDDALRSAGPRGTRLEDVTTTYQTQGCPARVSPTGGPSPIATLWSWCVDLAHDTGLLGPAPQLAER